MNGFLSLLFGCFIRERLNENDRRDVRGYDEFRITRQGSIVCKTRRHVTTGRRRYRSDSRDAYPYGYGYGDSDHGPNFANRNHYTQSAITHVRGFSSKGRSGGYERDRTYSDGSKWHYKLS